MNVSVLVGILAVLGALVGLAGAFLGRTNDGVNRLQIFVVCGMLAAAALEVFIVITGTKHPYVNIAVAALLGGTGIALLVRNLSRRPNAKQHGLKQKLGTGVDVPMKTVNWK